MTHCDQIVEATRTETECWSNDTEKVCGNPSCVKLASSLQRELDAAREEIARLLDQSTRLRKSLRELTRQVEETRRHANHDELTGLPNRRLFKDRMRQALAQAARKNRLVALVLVDLDGFKAINDSFGHSVGDELLRIVAERLNGSTRLSDTACRYGGDEFVVLFPDLSDRASVEAVTAKVRACFDKPCVLGGRSINVKASIGCAVYPDDAEDMGDLLHRADKAMYGFKIGGARKRDEANEGIATE
ncbi:diguanylate cyclase [Herbaspirillum sp. ST 5-3]|uniref:diguanylate cyclase domain-containing protein n=1 Tax=Oxalobacteraceae TaxID=75682 RepID=UPI001455E2FC|nr:diguanylate cyclase [Herbaspirillum sp. ST 5-3]